MKVIGIIGVIVILLFGGLFFYTTQMQKQEIKVEADKNPEINASKKIETAKTGASQESKDDLEVALDELDTSMPAPKKQQGEHIDDLISKIEDTPSSSEPEEKKESKSKIKESTSIEKLDFNVVKWQLRGTAKNVLLVDFNLTNKAGNDRNLLFTVSCSAYDVNEKESGKQKKDIKVLVKTGDTKVLSDQVFGRVSEETKDVKCTISPKVKEVFKMEESKKGMQLNALPPPEI